MDGPTAHAASGDAVSPIGIAAALAPVALLAACGGGGSGSSGGTTAAAPSTPILVAPTPPTAVQASRFLAQSSMGATRATIADVVAKGYDGWISDQFALPRATTHWDWLNANGYNVAANINSEPGSTRRCGDR